MLSTGRRVESECGRRRSFVAIRFSTHSKDSVKLHNGTQGPYCWNPAHEPSCVAAGGKEWKVESKGVWSLYLAGRRLHFDLKVDPSQ